MLHRISIKLTSLLFLNRTHDGSFEICVYGLELFLYSCLSTAGLLLIGMAFNKLAYSIIIILVFYICQTSGGGKHANSHIMCFLTMALFLCIALLLNSLNIRIIINIIVALISLTYLLIRPLVLHKNKKYLQNRTHQMKLVSRICVLFVAGIYILFFYINSDYCRPVGIGMLYAAFSRFSGYLSSKLKTT